MAKVEIEGYASTSDMDHARHVVLPGAFDLSIRQKGLTGPKGIKLLFAHDDKLPLGRITKLESRNRGLWLEAFIDTDISWGKDVAAASKAAGGLSFSIGFYLLDADIATDANKREYLKIIRGELFEVSVVVFPMNPEAVMSAEKAEDPFEKAMATLAKIKLQQSRESSRATGPATQKLTALLAQMKETLR